VGECVNVLEQGAKGLLVKPEDSDALAKAMKKYISDVKFMSEKADAYHEHINTKYSEKAILNELINLYTKDNK
jgi:glycosyltransferase involved in cell wall biosynthesis